MSYEYSEDGLVEAATQEVLEALGWTVDYAWTRETFSVRPDRSDGLLGRPTSPRCCWCVTCWRRCGR